MILVTGATGEFGKHAVQQLIKKGVNTSNISVLSRWLFRRDRATCFGQTVPL